MLFEFLSPKCFASCLQKHGNAWAMRVHVKHESQRKENEKRRTTLDETVNLTSFISRSWKHDKLLNFLCVQFQYTNTFFKCFLNPRIWTARFTPPGEVGWCKLYLIPRVLQMYDFHISTLVLSWTNYIHSLLSSVGPHIFSSPLIRRH